MVKLLNSVTDAFDRLEIAALARSSAGTALAMAVSSSALSWATDLGDSDPVAVAGALGGEAGKKTRVVAECRRGAPEGGETEVTEGGLTRAKIAEMEGVGGKSVSRSSPPQVKQDPTKHKGRERRGQRGRRTEKASLQKHRSTNALPVTINVCQTTDTHDQKTEIHQKSPKTHTGGDLIEASWRQGVFGV